MYEGGGLDLYQEFSRDVLKQNVVVFPILPAGPQAFGWFKRPMKNWNDVKGMKCRETGIAGEVFAAAGMRVVNMPGGEILPSTERGVIDGRRRHQDGLPQNLEVLLHARHAREHDGRRAPHQHGGLEVARSRPAGDRSTSWS